MKFIVDPKVFEQFQGIKLGLVLAKGIDNTKDQTELLTKLRQTEQQCRDQLDKETLTENPKIGTWREIYRSFGAKPSKYKSSIEALLRRVLQDNELPDINTLVNAYNLVSIKHQMPAGGDDIDHIDGDIVLTIADGSEPFIVMGADEPEHPKPGEVIYKDDKEVLCRRWNWRECNKSKMTKETKNVCLIIEANNAVSEDELKVAMQELQELVSAYCGGQITTTILNKENTSFELN